MKPWFKSLFNGQEMSFSHPMLNLQLGNIVMLPHDWLIQADFNMHTHGNTGSNIWVDCTNPMLSLSVSKDFFQRRLNVKLTGNDLFLPAPSQRQIDRQRPLQWRHQPCHALQQ